VQQRGTQSETLRVKKAGIRDLALRFAPF